MDPHDFYMLLKQNFHECGVGGVGAPDLPASISTPQPNAPTIVEDLVDCTLHQTNHLIQ